MLPPEVVADIKRAGSMLCPTCGAENPTELRVIDIHRLQNGIGVATECDHDHRVGVHMVVIEGRVYLGTFPLDAVYPGDGEEQPG